MNESIMAWIGFNAAVIVILVIDLLVFHRRPRDMKMREALAWSAFWVALALGFAAVIHQMYDSHWAGFGGDPDNPLTGGKATMQYIAGYLVELSLSVDNLFVFIVIFKYFGVTGHLQHRVLFWGILGAVIMRAAMILAGVALLERFHWLAYVLGAFLVFTGIKLALQKSDAEVDPSHNIILRTARKFLPIAHGSGDSANRESNDPTIRAKATAEFGGRFFVREDGRLKTTPLFLVLLVIETTDVIFAVDSVPAILGTIANPLTKVSDPFIAYTSNIMAILGLRAMYFALSGLMGLFHFLRFGLAAVLMFIGAKMLMPMVNAGWKIETDVSLAVVATLLGVSVLASLVWVKEHGIDEPAPVSHDEKP